MTEYLPLVIAIISAFVALIGYAHERQKERQTQMQKTRQEIHYKLIANLAKMAQLLDKLRDDTTAPDPRQDMAGWYAHIAANQPELWANIFERMEIQSLLSVYGTDESIKAVADYWRENIAVAQGGRAEPADLAGMIHKLRRTLFAGTSVTRDDIQYLLSR